MKRRRHNASISNKKSTILYRQSEQGATLIVVLLFLILIMLAGVIAVKQSNTDLKVATSDQIGTILLQSSDSANQKLESMLNGDPTSSEYQDVISASGVFGHFLLNPENATNEFIYCFNPRTKRYLALNATIRQKSGGFWSGLNQGICDYKDSDDYTSARQTVMTQVSVTTTPPEENPESFSHVVIGKEIENRTSTKFKFDIRAASALPAYSEPEVGSTNCFEQTSIKPNVGSNGMTLNECLLAATTPGKMLYEQVDVENVSASKLCIPFGKGSLDAKCVLSSTP